MIDKKIVWEIKHCQMEIYEDNFKFSNIGACRFLWQFHALQ